MTTEYSTQQILAVSLIQLLQTKSFRKISVDLISHNCCYSRRTFYNYFTDKFVLVRWIYENDDRFVGERAWNEYTYQTDSVLNKLIVISRNRNFYEKTFEEHMCKELFKEVFKDRMNFWITQKHHMTAKIEFKSEFFSYGFTDKIDQWLKGKTPLSPEEMHDSLMDCLPFTFRHTFNNETGVLEKSDTFYEPIHM